MGEPTYRPLTGDDLWVSGDALPGLLDGWCGPSEYERAAGLRLDCRRPEVRDHARRVLLAAGHDIGPTIEAELRGDITPTEAAGLVWCSLLRVEAGLGVVRGPLPAWKHEGESTNGPGTPTHPQWARRGTIVAEVGWYYVGRHDYREGWALRENVLHGDHCHAHGPETGNAGKLAADTAALAAGYAIREPGALLLPLPDGVVGRPETP